MGMGSFPSPTRGAKFLMLYEVLKGLIPVTSVLEGGPRDGLFITVTKRSHWHRWLLLQLKVVGV